MLRIKDTEVFGLERAIKASGNPMTCGEISTAVKEGENLDARISRAKSLGNSGLGQGHDHYLLGIHVQFDILYPQYWTIEAERYHNFEIISSQSKMHRLTVMMKDSGIESAFNKYVDRDIIDTVRRYCINYNKTDDESERYFWFMKAVSNLPMGFEMWMTCDLTYLQVKTMYFQRKNHKLKEDWGAFCEWVESLPMFRELVLSKEK